MTQASNSPTSDAAPPLGRTLFDLPAEEVYLDGGYFSPLPRSGRTAVEQATLVSSQPWRFHYVDGLDIPDRVRGLLGRLTGFSPGEIGLTTGTGDGVALLAHGLRYEKGDRTPHPDPEVKRIIQEVAREMGIEQRTFTSDEILRRLLFASVNEACKILEEGKALRASDVDVMWLHGFGFPRYRGGLMFWADQIGAKAVYEQVEAWHQRYGSRWRPSELLRDVARQGGQLREIKAAGV